MGSAVKFREDLVASQVVLVLHERQRVPEIHAFFEPVLFHRQVRTRTDLQIGQVFSRRDRLPQFIVGRIPVYGSTAGWCWVTATGAT